MIIGMEVWMKSQVSSSGQMEVQGCESLLKNLISLGLQIRVFATDRSTAIRSMMKKKFQWIKHQFDVW